MGFVGLKVTESRQVAGPTMFSFEEEKESLEITREELGKQRPKLFELDTPKPKKSNIEKLMGV